MKKKTETASFEVEDVEFTEDPPSETLPLLGLPDEALKMKVKVRPGESVTMYGYPQRPAIIARIVLDSPQGLDDLEVTGIHIGTHSANLGIGSIPARFFAKEFWGRHFLVKAQAGATCRVTIHNAGEEAVEVSGIFQAYPPGSSL